MPKTLKKFNGRGYGLRNPSDTRWDPKQKLPPVFYVCAYSRADAARVIEEYCGHKPADSLLRDYFNTTWGYSMKGITPERGLWLLYDHNDKPVRVV